MCRVSRGSHFADVPMKKKGRSCCAPTLLLAWYECYLVNLKLALCSVPSLSFTTSCRQPLQSLLVLHT